uniref:Uncharacterized protein n=1 Tax=Cacopsylla melanoneura TaxID=428564 RepID=A0A8D8QSC0_9HEMI
MIRHRRSQQPQGTRDNKLNSKTSTSSKKKWVGNADSHDGGLELGGVALGVEHLLLITTGGACWGSGKGPGKSQTSSSTNVPLYGAPPVSPRRLLDETLLWVHTAMLFLRLKLFGLKLTNSHSPETSEDLSTFCDFFFSSEEENRLEELFCRVRANFPRLIFVLRLDLRELPSDRDVVNHMVDITGKMMN